MDTSRWTAVTPRSEDIHRYFVTYLESLNQLLIQALDVLRGHNALGFETQVHDDLIPVHPDDRPLLVLAPLRSVVIVVLQQFLKCRLRPLCGQL